MVVILIFAIVYIIINNMIILEEETLVLIAGFFWLDAAGSLFKSYIGSELAYKGDFIKNRYRELLVERLMLLEALIEKLGKVSLVHSEIKKMIITFIYQSYILILEHEQIKDELKFNLEYNTLVVMYGDIIYNVILLEELQKQLYLQLDRDEFDAIKIYE